MTAAEARPAPAAAAPTRFGLRHALVSEATKLATLRGVWVTSMLIATVCILGAWSQAAPTADALRTGDPNLAPGVEPLTIGLEWAPLGVMGVILIGVIAGGSEYTSGQVATSTLAVPRRGVLLGSKVAVLTGWILLLGVAAIPAMSLIAQANIGDLSVITEGIPAELVLAWSGAIGYWLAMGLIAFALTLLLRSTVLPAFIVLTMVAVSLYLLMLTPAAVYLPTLAGEQLFDPGMIVAEYPEADLGWTQAAIVVSGWTVVMLAVGGLRFVRGDIR